MSGANSTASLFEVMGMLNKQYFTPTHNNLAERLISCALLIVLNSLYEQHLSCVKVVKKSLNVLNFILGIKDLNINNNCDDFNTPGAVPMYKLGLFEL